MSISANYHAVDQDFFDAIVHGTPLSEERIAEVTDDFDEDMLGDGHYCFALTATRFCGSALGNAIPGPA